MNLKKKLMSASKTTTDLKVIQKWAEERDGKPTKVKGVGGKDDGIIRIDFPGYSGEKTLEDISWDEWYDIFQDRKLAFLYQDETAGGKESRFFKLVNRDKNS